MSEMNTPMNSDGSGDVWAKLLTARRDYAASVSSAYDEVVDEVAGRIAGCGSIGKSDIGALLFWKRLRADTKWVRHLHTWSDTEVRQVTSRAVAAVRDTETSVWKAASAGRAALAELPASEAVTPSPPPSSMPLRLTGWRCTTGGCRRPSSSWG